MITSRRATLRAFSTSKRAKYLVFFTYIFWLLIGSHTAIFFTVINDQCTRVGIYAIVFTLYAILLIGLIPSLLLSIFACLTYRNMKQLRRRIQPTTQDTANGNHIIQRRDRDLLVLVSAEVVVYIITQALFPVILLETMISQYIQPNKSVHYFLAKIFMWNVAVFLLYIFSAAPFYTYMISSSSFRRDFYQLIVAGYQKFTQQTPNRPVPRICQIEMQRDTRV